jgi:GNAT superfamily N-acetyltransferase
MINGSRGLIMAKHTSMTHPDYQGSGLYAKVLQWSRDRFADMGVDLILSWPNRNSHPMQRNRSTYEDIYQIPTMKLSCPTCSRAQLIEIPFSETRSIDFQTWRDIAAETTSKSLFANIRTADYLSWRFKERPDVQYYFIEYREAGKLRSALIFKLFPSNEPQVVNVVEWLCEPECPEGGHVLEDLKEWAFSHGLPITIWHNVHDYPRHHLLERNGYVPSEPIFYFGAIPVGSQDRLGPFRDWRTWYMSMGDVDVF